MRSLFESTRRAAAFTSVLLVLALGCNVRVSPGPQPQQQQPQPQQPFEHTLGAPEAKFDDAVKLFNKGAEGEARYKGKVVEVSGRVNVEAVPPAPPGGTTVVSLEGGKGGKAHAVATVDEASGVMLSKSHWKPEAKASIHGIYRGRDQNGAILLDQARVMGLQAWSTLVKVQPDDKRKDSDKRKGDKDKDRKPADTVVVSPETLAQELTDDVVKNYPRYYKAGALQIKGVIHKRAEDKGMIVRIDFQVPVKLKGDKKDDFVIFCGLKDKVSLKDKEAADLAVGKAVTIRGKLTAGGNGQATLYQCEIVRD